MTELNNSADDDAVATNEVKPLTEWTNPPKLDDLKRHLEDSRMVHDGHVKTVDAWSDNMHIRNGAKPKTPANKSSVQPKLIRKQAEWRYPALSEPFLSSPDIFNVKPTTWEDRDSAIQNGMVLNNQFNTKIDKVSLIDEYVRTAVDEGTVILKTGWCFEQEEYQEDQPIVELVLDQAFAPNIQQIDQIKQESPSQYDTDVPYEMKLAYEQTIKSGYPYRPVIVGTERVTKTRTVNNHPTVEICDYRNVIIDPTAQGKIKNANFVIHSFDTSYSQLKKEGRYKNLESLQITNSSPLSQPDHTSDTERSNFNFADKPRAKIVAYEYWGYWDINGDGIVKSIVATWVGNQLIRMEENPFPDKALPFVLVQYLPVRKSNYGETDGELLIENQKIIGAVTRGMIDIMAGSANAQTGIRKDLLDAVNQRKYEKGEDYQFNPGMTPADGIYMHKFPEIPQSAPLMLQMMNQEAEALTAVKSFSGGVTGNSLGDVAAGVRGALDASSKRETAILRRLAKGIIEVGRKFISMNAMFLEDEEIIRITNEKFVKVRRDDLAGNFDLELSISTAEEDDNKAKELAFMLQTLGPNEDPVVRTMILSDICRLRKMPDLAHKLTNYKPEPSPMQIKMQELEIAMKEAEIAEVRAKTQQLLAQAGLAGTKAGTEQVKQNHIQADTDQKNLDFVEQESGVKQERELQKQGQKVQGDLQKEALKAQLAPKKETSEK